MAMNTVVKCRYFFVIHLSMFVIHSFSIDIMGVVLVDTYLY